MKSIIVNELENKRQCTEENVPVFITKNGNPKLVVMAIEYYEKNMRKICEAKTILSGLDDLKKVKLRMGRQ